MSTLYNLSPLEARTLLRHHDNDVALVAVSLWNRGKVNSIDMGLARAKRLYKHSLKACPNCGSELCLLELNALEACDLTK